MRSERVRRALRGVLRGLLPGRGLRREPVRRALFTLVAFLVVAVPSSAAIEGGSAPMMGEATMRGIAAGASIGGALFGEDGVLFGDNDVLFGDDGGDLFDADGDELDFDAWDIDEPWPGDVVDAGFAPEPEFFSDAEIARNLTADGIPVVAVQAYQRAAAASGVKDPTCGVPWTLLAAIGRVESDHGRFGGSMLLADGYGTRPIRGIPLDGRRGIALIRDTDGGRLDGDRTYDRAVGPMQFIPSTWRAVSVDGNGDRRSDPNNIFDATLGAAGYLCSGPGNLRDLAQRAAAVRRYNHTDEYVRVVLGVAAQYERRSAGQPPVAGPSPAPAPRPTPAPAPRPAPAPSPAPRPAPTPAPAPAPSPPTTAAPAPPTTAAPAPPTTAAPAPPTTAIPVPPPARDDPAETVPPEAVDAPPAEDVPPAAVGWSGTMLDFVTDTLAERSCSAAPVGPDTTGAPDAAPPGGPECPEAGEAGSAPSPAPAPAAAPPPAPGGGTDPDESLPQVTGAGTPS